MGKSILTVITITFVACGVLLINGCTKFNTTTPVISLNGDTKYNISLNSTYVDQGAVATDEVNGINGTVVVSSDTSPTNPNANLAGTYTIHYYAVNNQGQTGTATRTIIVSNSAQNIVGTYAVTDSITGKNQGNHAYTSTVTASSTLNNQLLLNNFDNLGTSVTVTSLVSGDTITIAPSGQIPAGMKNPGSINGSATYVLSGKTIIMSFHYIIFYNVASQDTAIAVWTKQ